MRKLVLILIIILSASLLLLAGCDDVVQYEGVKVVFMLEGGTFQNGEGSVVYYYQFPEGAQTLIRPLEDFASDDDDLVKSGYDLEGWYLTKKTDKDGNVSYTDKWNFDTDTVDAEGVTLYACWKKQVKYTYQVYDFDTDELIATREVNQGVKFNDRYATRNGYTLIGLFDENKNPWDSNFTHPGGETDTAVKVYAKYLEGDYTVVRTATELKIAANGNNNIYIANDIDMQGESLSFKNFTKEFLGNNCTISNFVLSYSSTKDSLVSDYEDNSKNSLSISLFGDTNGAKICDVNFTGVTVDVDAKTYTVVKPMVDVAFDAGDKAAVATVNTNKNIGIQLPVPANDQFVFRGWYVDEACETAVTLVDGKYVPTSSVTLYAKWDAKVTLTIVYGNGMANGVYDYGANDALDMEQYKPAGANNKFFEGWYTDEGLTQAFEATTITADTTVYVKWTDAGNYTLVSEGSYGFEYNAEGGYWANNNQGAHNSSASIKIAAIDGPVQVKVTYWISSEKGFDYLSSATSGTVEGTRIYTKGSNYTQEEAQVGEFMLQQGATLSFTYKKDGSGNNGDDTAYLILEINGVVVTAYVSAE